MALIPKINRAALVRYPYTGWYGIGLLMMGESYTDSPFYSIFL